MDKATLGALLCLLLMSIQASTQDTNDSSSSGAGSDIPINPGPDYGRPNTRSQTNPYQGNKEAIREGQRLFGWYNCSGCHAPKGGGGMGPPFSTGKWIYGGEAQSLFQSIWEGRPNGMPAWAGRIPPEAVWKIVAYIQTLPDVGPEDEPAFAPQDN